MQPFNQDLFAGGILYILKQFAYDMYIISIDKSMICTCVSDIENKNPNLECKKCLGTGYRIRIKKVKGANRTGKSSFRTYGVSENGTTNIFYFSGKYPIKENDLIVENNNMYIVERCNKETGAENKVIYYRAEANPVKQYPTVRISNFNEIIGDK